MSELMTRLETWRGDSTIRARAAEFGARLRSRTWDHMAREIVAAAEMIQA